jgi:tRNA-2-methylthio-N6-dimethylallyladenosine synthase
MKKYHIITIGCHMNQADSERIAHFIESHGYKSFNSWLRADLVILTTCGIRQAAEDRAYGLVNQIRKKNTKAQIVITGCLAKRKDVQRRLGAQVDLFMPINELPNIFKLLKNAHTDNILSADKVRELSGEKYLTIIPKYQSSFSAYLPIGNGCNNFCSYCVVPYARGREVYRSATDIIKEAKNLVAKGYKEIILIAQNVNSYQSRTTDFPRLLSKLASIKGDFWLRFSSSHPKDLSSDLIKVIASSDKICHHLHVAVQSGDDEILRAMNRKYTAKHFINLIKKIRKAKPGISIGTDAIVGFPGETKAQFKNTVKLFKELQFEMAYISRYSPRPGTASWQMKDNVSWEEKKRRELELDVILKKGSLKANTKYLKKTVKVLVVGENKKGKYYGNTSSFKNVQFKLNPKIQKKELIGSFRQVKITAVRNFSLEGELIS